MHIRTLFPAGIALTFLLAGCTPATPPAPPDTRAADAQAIRQLEADWMQASSNKDVDKITSFYADDGSIFLTGMPVVTGKANIAAALKALAADKNFSLSWPPSSTVVVSKSGDMAYSEGTYTMTYTDPKTKKAVSEKGKYVEVYMKQADGSWKDVADIGNSDGPATPLKAK
jgi:uncharacterized protein (TIGR02246 family)